VARFGTIRFSHGGQVHSIAYSPDGKMIASGSFGRVMLWEAGTGKPVGPLVQREGSGHHFGLAFAEDGRRLVSVGSPTATRDAGQIVFWDVAGRRSLDAIRVQHDAGLTHWMRVVAVAPDGRTGVIGSDDGELRLIDVPGQSVRIKVETGAAVSGLAYAPDGRTLAVVTSGRPGRVLLLDPTTAETRKRLEVDHARLVVFAPDGKSVWVGCDGGMFGKDKRPGMVSRWDLRSGTAVQTFETTPGLFLSLAVSPDGKTLASGGSESGAVVWDAATGKAEELGRPPGGRVRPWVHGLAFAPDGKTLAVADTGGRVRVWDVAARRERHPNPLGSGIHRVALAPDGRTAAAAGGDGSVWVWDVATGKDIRSWMADDTRSVTDVAYSPDGRSVLTSGADGTVRLWDVAGGKEIRRFPNGPHWARSALSPDGRLVAASGKDGLSIALYEAASGRPVRELTGHVSFLHQLTFSADGRRLVSSADMHHDGKGGGDDRSVRVWDVATGRQLHAFTGERPGHVAISPDGRVVAAFGSELEPSVQGHLRFWDAVSGREIADRRIGSTTERWTVAFSPDGRYLARAARDIRLVEVASGRTAQTFETGTGSVSGLAFTPDGRRLVSTQDDGTALVWDLAPRPMAGTDAGRLWEELASPDAAVARRAVAGLAADPAAAVTLLGEKLLPIPKPAGSRTTADLIADLGSPDFATREAASQKLTARAGVDATELTAALAASTSPEVRQRLNDALRSTPGPWPTLSADDLRRVRAVAVLEAVASPDARQRLRALADGDPDARLTREARAAVVRLGG
jgi:WD40 repeat protein